MTFKSYTSVNSLSSSEKDHLRAIMRDLNDSMTRAESEKEYQKEMIDTVCEKLNLDKKIVRRIAKTYFKANYYQVHEENETFDEFYEIIINSTVADAA